MFCPRCGTENDDRASSCTNCGSNLPRQDAPKDREDDSRWGPPPAPPPGGPGWGSPPPPPPPSGSQWGQQQGYGQPISQSVPNYLVQAILTTIFCCQPFGIVAIVYAAQVNGKQAAGDIAGAVESSNKAKTWCWVAFGSGLVVVGGFFLIGILGSLGGSTGSP